MTPPDDLDQEIEALDKEFGTGLRAWLRGRLGGLRAVADDAYQDALLAVYLRRCAGHPIVKPKPYLYRAAWNAAVDILKRERHEHPDSDFLDRLVDDNDALDAVENAELVRSIIGRLPMRERRVLVLRDLCRFTVGETAEILAIPAGTIGPATTRARAYFRLTYQQEIAVSFREEDDQ